MRAITQAVMYHYWTQCWALPHTGYLTPNRQGHFCVISIFHLLISNLNRELEAILKLKVKPIN